VALQQGTLRQTKGVFDSVLRVAPGYRHVEDTMENTQFYDPERVKRGVAQGLNRSFTALADILAAQRRLGRGDLPLCPVEGTYSSYVATLPGTAVPVPLCRPASQSMNIGAYNNIANGGDFNTWAYRLPATYDAMSAYDLQAMLGNVFGVQVSTALLNVRERSYETLDMFESISRSVAVNSGLIYDRLGDLPGYVYSNTTSVDAEFFKTFRNGSVVLARASFDGKGLLYRGKPIDPTFGGSTVPNTFGSRIEAGWSQPLMRGRGADTVQAPERAAGKNLEASQFTFQQTSADQALSAAEAYFGLVAAEDALALTRQSLENQRRVLENTIKLVAAGEVASADLARTRARASEVESDVHIAQAAVVSAQSRLADALGLAAADLSRLAAADRFPSMPSLPDLDAMAKQALARRADVKALTSFRDTSRILVTAARAEMRPRFDLTFTVGATQTYYGPAFYSLPDEVGSRLPADSWVAYYNPSGVGRALRERWVPVAAIVGTFELPFGNNRRAGNFAQASASARESEIRLADLGRSISNAVPRLAEDVRRARLEWQQAQESVTAYETTWDATQRLRAAGEMNLIDTLLTEQHLMRSRLQLVQAKRVYAIALARFKRETGTLVNFSDPSHGQPDLGGLVAAR
jgi:outer membrane protein TolC